jgi:hypothetical protein
MSPGRKWSRLLRYVASSVGTVTLLLKVRLIGVMSLLAQQRQTDYCVGALPIAGLAADKAGSQSWDFVTVVNFCSNGG